MGYPYSKGVVSDMAQYVTTVESGFTARITLNLPEKRNPISAAMRSALIEALDALKSKSSVRAVIITGAGNAFCSGLDLESLAAQSALSPSEHLADSQSIADFMAYIASYPKPTIAAVNGPAMAGGAGLALLCDVTLVSTQAYFSFSEVKIGFVPAIVGVYLQRAIGPKAAHDLLLTGRKVSADESVALKLANRAVPPEDLLRQAAEIADLIAQNSPSAVGATKHLLFHSGNSKIEESINLAVKINAEARSTADCKEGVRAFLEKRPPQWLS